MAGNTARARATARPAYTQFAAEYDALFGELDRACLDFVEAVLPPPAALLDAGCATGRYGAALAERGYDVVGVDRQPQLLPKRPAPGVDVLLADLRRLPFEESFDLVLARGVLNDLVEVRDLNAALNSIAEALREDRLFIADVRERGAHRSRVAAQPVSERSSRDVAFRSSRTMDATGAITSYEQFSRDGNWTEPHQFLMRTFTENEVRLLWREAGLDIASIERSYGSGSRLTDRLVVVARKRREAAGHMQTPRASAGEAGC